MKKVIHLSFILSLLTTISYAQDFNEVQRLMASDGELVDQFGYSVSISGNYAIVGSYREAEDEYGGNTMPDAGSAYVFERDSYGTWHQVQKLVTSDRKISEWFGYCVYISGKFAIVGAPADSEEAPGENPIQWSGSAYIFERNANGVWYEIQKLTASDRASWDCFGVSVCISENMVIVGAPSEDEDASGLNTIDYAGSAYIFERDNTGTWQLLQKIVPSNRGEFYRFGFSVSLSDNLVIIGAYQENGGAGAVYVFEPDGLGFWHEVQRLLASDQDSNDLFGTSVCLNEEYIVIGSPHDEDDASDWNDIEYAGSAYIFERDTTGIWQEVQKLVPSDRAENDWFGCQVGISGNYAIIGSVQEDEDALGNNTMQNAGSAYIFNRNDAGTWNQIQKVVAPDRSEYEYFGTSVSISGDYAVVGTYPEEGNGIGSVYVFESCDPSVFPDPDNILENGDFESCMLSPWTLYFHDYLGVSANDVLIDGKWKIEINTLADEPQNWHVQALQDLSASQIDRFETGATYTVSFEASAGSDNRQCNMVLGQNENPYTSVIENLEYLGTEPKTYTFDFVLDKKFSKMKFTFDIGAESTPVTFDNVRLIKKEDANPDALSQTKPSDLKIFPNPASDQLNVIAWAGSEIRVYNTLGQLVITSVTESATTKFSVNRLPDGLYYIVVKKEDNTYMQKIVIQ